MRTQPLVDDDTHQSAQLRELGADLYIDGDEDDEPAYGADPFDILAHKQEQGDLQ